MINHYDILLERHKETNKAFYLLDTNFYFIPLTTESIIEIHKIDRLEDVYDRKPTEKYSFDIDAEKNIFQIGGIILEYPEDTTHIKYDEYKKGHFRNFPYLLKLEDGKLYIRDVGRWNLLKNGKYIFLEDEIKSIDDIVKDKENPGFRDEFLIDIIIDILSGKKEVDMEYDKSYYFTGKIDDIIVSVLENHRDELIKLVNEKPLYDSFLHNLGLMGDDGFLVTEIVIYSKNLERAYYYVMKNFEFRQ